MNPGGIGALLCIASFTIAILSGSAAAFSGFGSRWGVWHFSTGFTVLKIAAIGGVLAVIIAVPGILLPKDQHRLYTSLAVLSVIMGFVVAGIPWTWLRDVKRLPMIHDITTDTQDPPQFEAVLSLRKDAQNPTEYGGPEIAAQQRKAYPDITSTLLSSAPDKAYDRALAAAKKMGWRIAATDRQQGRIEASDRTFWYGFIDDIVVRVRPEQGGSRVDVRSLSRVGESDVGTNARRIRRFLKIVNTGS